jgi:hypothetical protein
VLKEEDQNESLTMFFKKNLLPMKSHGQRMEYLHLFSIIIVKKSLIFEKGILVIT